MGELGRLSTIHQAQTTSPTLRCDILSLRNSSPAAHRLPEISLQRGRSRSDYFLGNLQLERPRSVHAAGGVLGAKLSKTLSSTSRCCAFREPHSSAVQARSHDKVRLFVDDPFLHIDSIFSVEKSPHSVTTSRCVWHTSSFITCCHLHASSAVGRVSPRLEIGLATA